LIDCEGFLIIRAMRNGDSEQAAAQYRLGIAAGRERGARVGLPHLKAAIELDAARGDYWLAYCEALAACGETATAIAVAEGARQQGLSAGAMEALIARLCRESDIAATYSQAVKDHGEGRLQQAAAAYRKVLDLKPDFAEAHVNFASVLQAQGGVEEAIGHFRHAIALKPDFAEAHYNLGNALSAVGHDPLPAYAAAVAARPDYAEAHYNRGIALERAGRQQEAAQAYRAAIKARPDFAAAHTNLGVLLFAAGDMDEALAAYDAALGANPSSAAAHSNKGNALRAKGALDDAENAYKRAVGAQPRFAEGHNHLGDLYRAGGRLEEAIASYRAALDIKPDLAGALYGLGYALTEHGTIGEGFAALTRHAALRADSESGPDLPHKRLHDQEQRIYLGPAKPDPLGPLWLEDGGRLAGPALNCGNDIAAIERQWESGKPQLVVIDDFLTEEALTGLRRFCWGSTIWREVYEKGYLGAFPEHGVACPLLAQIADELKKMYRKIFLDHPLLQLWAFKYESRLGGIPLHADFAAVNVNFWITPDEANRNTEHGGLVVWDVPAPLDWNFEKYNVDPAAGGNFLAAKDAHATIVPHRSNRAVIFDSDLFHETDSIDFKGGYLNRRINLTLLYGRRAAHMDAH
jgi:tetratricopeptide (TPR) repeat protein